MGAERVLPGDVRRKGGTGSAWRVGPPAPAAKPPVELAGSIGLADWRGDVALELWVDAEVVPARVKLAGRLDSTTAASLAQVMRELLADGTREIELATDGLRSVDSSAIGALADIERMVRERHGTLTRVGPVSGPFTRNRLSGSPPAVRS